MISTANKHEHENRKPHRRTAGAPQSGADAMVHYASAAPPGCFTGPPDLAPVPGFSLGTVTLLVLAQIDARAVTVWSTFDVPNSVDGTHGVDVDLQLVQDARCYLRSLRQRRTPGPPLREAWNRFFKVYDPLVRKVVKACGVGPSDGDDCMQEVWIAIIRGLERLVYNPRKGRLCCWVLSVIRNRVIDFIRSESRRRPMLSPNLEGVACCRQLDPKSTYQQDQKRALVSHVLGHLKGQVSAANYQVVHLRWIESRDVPEVAARLDFTPEQVRYRHYRAKQRLCALLEAHGQCEP